MGIEILQVDAFTDTAFHGNPAAVCFPEPSRGAAWMQDVAREMNLAETAFLVPSGNGSGDYSLRWFTPTVEVDICGHATLASAHALWQTGRLSEQGVARFHTRSGLLTAERRGEWIELDFPLLPDEPVALPEELARALGVAAEYVGRSKFDYLVDVGSEAALRRLRPDLAALRRVEGRGVIVTSRSEDQRYDFLSRYFAPNFGIDEDSVTGSSHCTLAPYWSRKLGRTEMTGYQASARGGVVRVRLERDRVRLGGKAVTVLKGELV